MDNNQLNSDDVQQTTSSSPPEPPTTTSQPQVTGQIPTMQTTQASTDTSLQSQSVGNVKTSKKIPKIAILALGLLLLIGGGSAAAYYGVIVPNRPENRVKSALFNLIDAKEAKVSGTISGDDLGFDIEMTGAIDMEASAAEASLTLGFQGISAEVQSRVVDGKIYINPTNLAGLEGLASLYLGSSLDLASLENQWIEIDDSILDSSDSSCETDVILGFSDEDRSAFKDAYSNHPLFTVEESGEGEVDGSSLPKFELKPVSEDEANQFFNQVIDTMPLVKEIEECTGEEIEELTNDSTEDVEETTKLYTYLDGKTIKRLEMVVDDSDMKVTVTIDFNFDEDVTIEAPADAKPFAEVLSSLYSSGFGSSNPFESAQSSARDSERKVDINAMYAKLEEFYNENGFYPEIITEVDFSGLDDETLIDPNGRRIVSSPTSASQSNYDGNFTGSDYLYGSYRCNIPASQCEGYILVAILETGERYERESLN